MRRAAGGLAAAEEDAPTQEELDAEQEDEGRHHILLAHWLAGCPGVMLFLTRHRHLVVALVPRAVGEQRPVRSNVRRSQFCSR